MFSNRRLRPPTFSIYELKPYLSFRPLLAHQSRQGDQDFPFWIAALVRIAAGRAIMSELPGSTHTGHSFSVFASLFQRCCGFRFHYFVASCVNPFT